MAIYNTFVVQKTNGGRVVLVTSSARKARELMAPGLRVEVWNSNVKVETIYYRTRPLMALYIEAEREYIRAKQAAAELKNQRRGSRANSK